MTELNFRDIGRDFAGLPMPRNPELLKSTAGRPRVLDGGHKRFPFPVPNGWFIVARADELAAGAVMPLYCFGRDLVLFRTASGAPRVMDAHCPHLGAHLGVGGRVNGETIQCPFHGWRFEGASGACVEVPYDAIDFIPKRAHTRSYPTIERNQMIWAWHHLEGGEPFYDVPVVPEFDDPDWLPMDVREFAVASCCQEMAENNYDTVHFKYVHGSEAIPQQNDVIDGFYKRSETLDGTFVREGFGLGLGVLRMNSRVHVHLPVQHHAHRRRKPACPLAFHLSPLDRRGSGPAGGRQFLCGSEPGHSDLGEQDLQGPAGATPHGESCDRTPALVTAVLLLHR